MSAMLTMPDSTGVAMRIAITATPSQLGFAAILWRGDVAAAFRAAAELGCQGVELHLRHADDIDLDCLKRLIADSRLEVPTLGTGLAAGLDGLTLSDPEESIRQAAVERAAGHIRLAAELGAAVIIGFLAGRLGASDDQEWRTRRAWALEGLAALCRLAQPLGVTLLLEPLNRYESDYINTLSDAADILREIGAPNLKLLADTFHMNIEEADLAASLRAAGPRVGHVHLADTNRQAPGHGHLDIAGILGALDEIGYKGYLSFEVYPLPNARRAVEDGIAAIRAAAGDSAERSQS